MGKKRYSQRKNGLFETTKTINGRRIRFYGRTCAEIDRKILEYNVQAKQGRKLEVIGKEWLELREKDVAVGTYVIYDRYMNEFLSGFGKRRAGDVTALELMRYVAGLEAKGYHRTTVNANLTVIKQMFSHAVRMGDVDVNPAREVYPSRNLPRSTRRALTEDEERRVEEFRGDDWLLGVMLLWTGLRRGELLALEWKDIDRRAGTITVNKKINWCDGVPRVESRLKSENGNRPRPLLAPLADVLPGDRIGLIFPSKKGGYLTCYEFEKRFRAYRKAVGLPDDITAHCFRHSYATICFDAGLDAKEAAAFLGDTEEMVRKVYMELRDSRRVSSADKVSAYLQMRAEEREGRAGMA